jgi:hypothetical protein
MASPGSPIATSANPSPLTSPGTPEVHAGAARTAASTGWFADGRGVAQIETVTTARPNTAAAAITVTLGT